MVRALPQDGRAWRYSNTQDARRKTQDARRKTCRDAAGRADSPRHAADSPSLGVMRQGVQIAQVRRYRLGIQDSASLVCAGSPYHAWRTSPHPRHALACLLGLSPHSCACRFVDTSQRERDKEGREGVKEGDGERERRPERRGQRAGRE